ncbi:histidine kinase [Paenibacillus sedimenti]|uniref:histidine kinase n=1 Tax=Paenibacillus sedimenti TaxID=2770274 RepID=UPI0035E3E2E3
MKTITRAEAATIANRMLDRHPDKKAIDASTGIQVFKDHFQNSERLVPLEQELALVRSYLYIEKERFDGTLEIVWEVDAGMKLKIPPLSIQLFVENAVRHGIMRRSSGGKILIQITEC